MDRKGPLQKGVYQFKINYLGITDQTVNLCRRKSRCFKCSERVSSGKNLTEVVEVMFALRKVNGITSEPSPEIIVIEGGKSGTGITTRYWDCCAPSCAWDEIIHTKNRQPISTCQKDGVTKSTKENNAQSGCEVGGVAYSCSNQHAYLVNSTLAYGFSAVSFTGGIDYNNCCICLLLSFQGKLLGKKMLVQITNTGSPLAVNQFDIAIPGGGVGLYTLGCSTQWGTPESGWGDRTTGVTSEEECNELPEDLQSGCKFRFEYMEGIDNPDVSFVQVKCPAELVNISGCGDL